MQLSKFVALLGVLVLGGCAEWRTMEGAEAADAGLRGSLWVSCQSTSIGAVRRWLGEDVELAQAYDTICRARPTLLPIIPRNVFPIHAVERQKNSPALGGGLREPRDD